MEQSGNSAINANSPYPGSDTRAFRTGDVCRHYVARFLDVETCRAWIIDRLHPQCPVCPGCSKLIVSGTSLRSFRLGARVRCSNCGKFFTALTGTFLSGGHLSFSGVVLMAILIESGATDANIARLMEMSVEGVRSWRGRFAAADLSVISGQGIRESRDGDKGGRGCE